MCKVVKLCTLFFLGELGFLNCDDIGMCVVNKQFELLDFIFNSVYVDLKYNATYLTFLGLCGVCSHVVVLCLSVILGLLFGLDVSILKECEGAGNADVGDGGSVTAVRVGYEYMGGTRGSGIVSNATDVLGMGVVVCAMCKCLARDGEWIRGLGLVFINPVETE